MLNLFNDFIHITAAFLSGSVWGFICAYFYWRDEKIKKIYIYPDNDNTEVES